MIHNIPTFQEQVRMAAQTADDRDVIVTFAVPPTHASTAFGYLHLSAHRDGPVADVLRFVEKPDHPTAEEYLRSGQYGWNAGMFAWRAEVFLGEARRQQPDLAAFVEAFPAENPDAFVAERFPGLPKISVDYAVMENAAKVVAIEAAFDWDDVGSWTALPRHLGHDDNGNTFRGLVTAVNTRDSIAVSNGRMIALCGVENLIVIETADAILVCTRDAAQEIKKLQPGLPRELT
jgi:mannose-1-phosphate guanylyltransferase